MAINGVSKTTALNNLESLVQVAPEQWTPSQREQARQLGISDGEAKQIRGSLSAIRRSGLKQMGEAEERSHKALMKIYADARKETVEGRKRAILEAEEAALADRYLRPSKPPVALDGSSGRASSLDILPDNPTLRVSGLAPKVGA